jgi:hypothetical protein
MSDVIHFPKKQGSPGRKLEMIAELEKLLDEVKADQVGGIAFAACNKSGGFKTVWEGGVPAILMLGALHWLTVDIREATLGDER